MDDLSNRPMNNPDRFRTVFLAMARDRLEINRREKEGEISGSEAEQLRAKVKQDFLAGKY